MGKSVLHILATCLVALYANVHGQSIIYPCNDTISVLYQFNVIAGGARFHNLTAHLSANALIYEGLSPGSKLIVGPTLATKQYTYGPPTAYVYAANTATQPPNIAALIGESSNASCTLQRVMTQWQKAHASSAPLMIDSAVLAASGSTGAWTPNGMYIKVTYAHGNKVLYEANDRCATAAYLMME